ncbi:MAG TPA: alpha/beta hydrolase [Ramlibacter sp.]|jgi:pimeloyl-ACP methyl ester carboxylesterase
MIETFQQALPHGITLSCRAAGERGRPVLMFLHGFPEAAFAWDEMLEHFSRPQNGGYRCIAPNLRGYEKSSQPREVELYLTKHVMRDVAALIELQGAPIECLVAHDWGGASAWTLANKMPQLIRKLAIINSPHPGTFLRELKSSPKQQQASGYMNFLIRPDAEDLLRANGYERLFKFLALRDAEKGWLTADMKRKYVEVWDMSLTGGLNYYRASQLRPPRPEDPAAAKMEVPREALLVKVPTLVLWGMDDTALPPELVDGLGDYVSDLTLERVPGATHWIIHERPAFVAERLGAFLER